MNIPVLGVLRVLVLVACFAGAATAQQKHDWVDLGLPSGTLWATCNIGASNPWEPGEYIAWGETASKLKFNWEYYQYANGDPKKLIKYCNLQPFGNDGYTDKLKMLEDADDAAVANWGSEWQIPSAAQSKELMDNSIYEWTVNYNGKGVAGWVFKSKKNDAEIFLPAAGFNGAEGVPARVGDYGFYWLSSLDTNSPSNAFLIYFHSGYVSFDSKSFRYYGYPIRPVRHR